MHAVSLVAALFLLVGSASAGEWTFVEKPNEPGTRLEVQLQGKPVAALVYGERQIKPYLHVYGREGDLLTEWNAEQQFPHHRGIFIGWNKLESDLGKFDLWHMSNGGRMEVKQIAEQKQVGNAAVLQAEIEWHGGKKDSSGSSLLLRETRTFRISQPEPDRTQIDVHFRLKAARGLDLNGDLQHSGIHFRAAHHVAAHEDQTSYVWEPDLPGYGGKVIGDDLKWCRFLFPIGKNWYSVTELNSPKNPVEQLSWRAYGRFGFFFTQELAEDAVLDLDYRFVAEPAPTPETEKHSEEQLKAERVKAADLYADWLKEPKS